MEKWPGEMPGHFFSVATTLFVAACRVCSVGRLSGAHRKAEHEGLEHHRDALVARQVRNVGV
jgi:hypothetical protein